MANSMKPASAFEADSNTFPRLDVARKDPLVKAVTDKLVADPTTSNVIGRKNRTVQAPDLAMFEKITSITANNITASASLLQMLPDTELAMQILVSSILSPKDMVSSELTYSVEPGQFNNELAGPMLECLRTYYDGTYKMGDLLPKVLQDALFYTGSYPLLVLPENSIDEAINSPTRVTMESIRGEIDHQNGRMRPVGILANVPKVEENAPTKPKDFMGLESLTSSLEDYRRTRADYEPAVGQLGTAGFESYLSIHDNPNTLKMPILQDKMRQDRLQDLLASRKLSMESSRATYFNKTTKREEQGSLYLRRRYKNQPVVAVTPSSNLKKKSVGHPLVLHLPSESVIPVHVPSNPEEHLGYFVLLDELGNPLVRAYESDYYANMGTNLANNDVANRLIQKTAAHTNGREDPLGQRRADIEEMTRIYGDLVENELLARLKNGVYGENVQVSKPQEVYRIMFARSLARMRTQALYVPAEMMTYIAFDYNQYGIGESLIQKSKIIGGLRVMLSFANTMAAIKNSIGRTKMGIQLDPADDDPSQTVEFLVHEHSKMRQGAFPLGNPNPSDIINYFQNASIELEVSGNTAYPETKVMLEDLQAGRIKPDTELEELLKKRHLMSLSLSPETVDAGMSPEFATSIVNNNLLLTKRVMIYQTQLVSFLEEFIQKYTLSSGALMEELRQIIEDNRDKLQEEELRRVEEVRREQEARRATDDAGLADPNEERPLEQERQAELRRRDEETASDEESDLDLDTDTLIMQFIQAVRVSLPAPDTSTLENQMAAYEKYAEALDKTLEAYLDTGFLATTEMGELEEYIEPTIKAVRAYYLRQWLRNNNVMPELDELATLNEDETPALDLLEIHENHIEGIGKSLLTYLKALAATRKKLDPQVAEVKQDLGGGGDVGGNDGGMDGDQFGSDTNADDLGGDGTDDLGGSDADANATDPDASDGDDLTADLDTADAGDGTADEQPDATATADEGGEEADQTEVADTDSEEEEEEESSDDADSEEDKQK